MSFKILVVDDEKSIVDFVKMGLEAEGYIVYSAFDGNEAIELANMVTSWDKYDESGKKISTQGINQRERTLSSTEEEKGKHNYNTIEEVSRWI